MLYLAIVSLIWAASFGLIKRYLAGVDASFVAAVRLLLSLAVFLPFVRLRGVPSSIAAKLAAVGAIQFGLMYVFYLHAFAYLAPGEVALFTIFTPLLVTLLDDLAQWRMSWLFLCTASLAVAGTAICLWTQLHRQGLIAGFVVMQLSNLCFAAGQVAYRRIMPKVQASDSQVMGLLYAGGFVASGIAAAVALGANLQQAALSLKAEQVLVLVYLGVVASGLGFFWWNAGARRTNVGALAIFNNAKIPLGLFASLLIVGGGAAKSPLAQQSLWAGPMRWLAGGAVLILALWLNQRLCRGGGSASSPQLPAGLPGAASTAKAS